MRKIGWIFLASIALLTSCGKSMPDEVIPPAKMESVLYDYHLVLGISSTLNATEEYKKQSYKNYLFKKHRITEAQFDSSMVWYTRHSQELATIYQNLDKRFSREKMTLNNQLQDRHIDVTTQSGDTVNLWNRYPLYWLTGAPMNNNIYFDMRADSNFWAMDAFLWKADITFLKAGKVTMGLNVRFKNDSVIGNTLTITQSGTNSIYLPTDSTSEIRDINGFIHVYKDSTFQEPSVIINNLSLTKYHKSEEKIVPVANNKAKKPAEKDIKLEEKTPSKAIPIKKGERITSRPKRQLPKE